MIAAFFSTQLKNVKSLASVDFDYMNCSTRDMIDEIFATTSACYFLPVTICPPQ
jgi:hypothetical protein